MRISVIVAMDQQRGIGLKNDLPWKLPEDLKHFKRLTTGHHIIMGRKTYESIGRPLPNRTSIVVTRNAAYRAEGCLVANSLGDALELANSRGEEEVFLIGGGSLYKHAMPLADTLYLTRVHAQVDADTFFPPIGERWKVVDTRYCEADERHAYPYSFETLKRL